MANYTIDRSLTAAGSITVTEATIDTSTNVTLVGQNFTGYGDEIATNFLQMLENFAADVEPNNNPRVPGSTAITGQLWYDTANDVLKVFGGTTWEEMSKINTGSTESSTLRWNNTNGRWQPEERVRVSDAGSLQIAFDGTTSNQVNFNHGGTNLVATFTGTTDFTLSGLTGDLTLVGPAANQGGLSVEHDGTALAIRADGTTDVINITASAATAINMPAGVKVNTAATGASRAGFALPHGTAPSAPVNGDLWTTSSGVFARVNGSTVQLDSTAGGTVTGTGANDQLAVWTGASDIDGSANLTFNGTTLAVTGAITATTFGGIASANLVDRSAPGTLAATTFSGNVTFQANLDLQDNDNILFGTGDDVSMGFDGSDLNITSVSAVDLNITGFANVVNSSAPIYAGTGILLNESFRAIGSAPAWSTSNSYMSFYDSDQTEHGMQIGTTVGDGANARVSARLGNLRLLASNTQVFDIGSASTTVTQSSVTAAVFRNSFTTNNTTSLAITDNNNNQHNAGYNETPLADDIGANINTGSFTLGNVSIGKFISRTTGTSRTLTLGTSALIPIGATVLVHNGSASGTFTIATSGTTLTWIDGSGTTVTGNRTLANNSIATIRKSGATAWQIWGNGLS